MNFLQRILKTKKFGELKEKINSVNKKYKITNKLNNVKDKVGEVKEKVENKIEAKLNDKISYEDVMKVEMKIGKIIEAEKIEKSDKLLKLKVSFENEERQIVSGIAQSYTPKQLKNKKALFVTNIEPRKIFGLESDGMILGAEAEDKSFTILEPSKETKEGTKLS